MLARCVMQKICRFLARFLICAPTATATSPPIPVSISSKIRVSTPSVRAKMVLSASITRESSPPEAIFARGSGGFPGFALIINSISSFP